MTANDVFIVSAVRTPTGSFGGSLSTVKATELGSIVIRGALEKAGVKPEHVDEVFMGNVLSAGLGQAPARQAALGASIPASVPCTTVNKVCSSGLKATMLGSQCIALGHADVVVVGGMENMSKVPFFMPSARFGARMGHTQMVDGLINDGLWDVYNDFHMGHCGEKCAKDYNISREDQDDYAIRSYTLGAEATKNGAFAEEIVPVTVPQRRGAAVVVTEDEEYKNYRGEQATRGLRPSFQRNGGTVTAANASPLSDGASALVLVSGKKVQELGLKPLAVIRGYGDAARDPVDFTVAPSLAVPVALKRAGLTVDQMDFVELNEAFSVVACANAKLLNLDMDKVNVNGGAVSLGHALGSSGSRILVTLLHVLHKRGGRYGVAGICNGGGGASAMVIEKM